LCFGYVQPVAETIGKGAPRFVGKALRNRKEL
jgi:hypothetical protein